MRRHLTNKPSCRAVVEHLDREEQRQSTMVQLQKNLVEGASNSTEHASISSQRETIAQDGHSTDYQWKQQQNFLPAPSLAMEMMTRLSLGDRDNPEGGSSSESNDSGDISPSSDDDIPNDINEGPPNVVANKVLTPSTVPLDKVIEGSFSR